MVITYIVNSSSLSVIALHYHSKCNLYLISRQLGLRKRKNNKILQKTPLNFFKNINFESLYRDFPEFIQK